MEHEHFVIFIKLSRMGEDDSSSTTAFTEQDMDEAIDRAVARYVADGWEQNGPVRRDGPNAEVPVRRPGSGVAGAAQLSALAHLILAPRVADEAEASESRER
jgi:hypothetical protein